MKIAIFMFTMGRWDYVNRALRSIRNEGNMLANNIHLHLCCQGVDPDYHIDKSSWITIHKWDKNIGIAAGMNKVIPQIDADIVMKMDEDCRLISNNFFDYITDISITNPDLVYSPYPVGLINNPGGVKGIRHETAYSDYMRIWYTYRIVDHVGGFARIMPGKFVKAMLPLQDDLGIPGASGNEDIQVSTFCKQNGIKMAYLENAIVVEHQESTLGQHKRYPEHFKDRF
jgi:hypothetical protein